MEYRQDGIPRGPLVRLGPISYFFSVIYLLAGLLSKGSLLNPEELEKTPVLAGEGCRKRISTLLIMINIVLFIFIFYPF